MTSLFSQVLRDVKTRREKSISRDSFIDRVLNGQNKTQLSRNKIYFLDGVWMKERSDTSSSLILTILMTMMAYSQVQEKYVKRFAYCFFPVRTVRLRKGPRAQIESDAAIGEQKSSRWSDLSKLLHINMIIKGSHRWRPVSSLGVPHALAKSALVIDIFFFPSSTPDNLALVSAKSTVCTYPKTPRSS